MNVDLSSSITRLRDAVGTIAGFSAAGCVLTDSLLSCRVAIPETQSTGVPHKNLLDEVRDLSDVHLVFEAGSLSFELTGTPVSQVDFLSDPAGDPGAAFQGPMLKAAERAWQGDVEAAMTLAGSWRGDVSVRLHLPLEIQVPQVAWRVVRTIAVLVDAFAEYPWWRIAELIRADERPVFVVVLSEERVGFHTPSFGVSSLDMLQDAPVPPGMGGRRRAVQASTAARLPGDVALPEELLPSDEGADPRLQEALTPKAEACAWAWLSNGVVVADDPEPATLEFFGYRRKAFVLGRQGYVGDPGQRAFSAYRWATVEESPDRVLAVRQVISLQDGDMLPVRPDDVVSAAEPLYRALRASEVGAVLETKRQARSIAIDIARQSADAAQAAAKSAAERTIVSLGAVAGIAVAHATAVLSDTNSRAIAIGIAGLFVFLAFWAIFVEGPPMRSPIASLSEDLPKIGYLLTETERRDILDMNVVKKAKESVLRIQIITPATYLLGAALTIGVAHVQFGLTLL